METVKPTHKVKTRKKHSCFACLRTFPKKFNMLVQVNVYVGQIYRVYSCETCDYIMNKYRDLCYSDVDDLFHEGCVKDIPPYHFNTEEQEEYKQDPTPNKILEILNRRES